MHRVLVTSAFAIFALGVSNASAFDFCSSYNEQVAGQDTSRGNVCDGDSDFGLFNPGFFDGNGIFNDNGVDNDTAGTRGGNVDFDFGFNDNDNGQTTDGTRGGGSFSSGFDGFDGFGGFDAGNNPGRGS
jgi:hypothetical protein